VVTIANNHIHDDGADGVATTQTLCTAAGLAVVGPQLQPHFLPTDNGTVAFIAADLSQPQPAPLGEIAAAVSAAKHNSAWVVVSFHTAGPALYRPSAVLRSAADRVLAAGASIVVAHGSHTVAPVERRAEAVVAWGLGNLVFNCDCSIETEGMLLRVELTAGQPIRASVIPLQAGVAGASAVVYGPEGASFALFAAMGGATLQVDAGLGSF
jgi:poly-gamma-glutamate capsule biosynthesis protein CapA/YwtB (metallophosphatase superfamily)